MLNDDILSYIFLFVDCKETLSLVNKRFLKIVKKGNYSSGLRSVLANAHISIYLLFEKKRINAKKLLKFCNFEMSKFLINRYRIALSESVLEQAILSGDIKTVGWMLSSKCPAEFALLKAARNGDANMVRFLREIRIDYSWEIEIHMAAAQSGNLELVKMLKEIGATSSSKPDFPKWDCRVFNYAALSGNLDLLKYLYENKCEWNCETFDNAIIKGNLENVLWLYEKGCPARYSAYIAAGKKNDIRMLEWLLEKKIPKEGVYSESDVFDNSMCRSIEVLNWLWRNEFPMNVLSSLMRAAVRKDTLSLRWLKEKIVNFSSYLCAPIIGEAAQNGKLHNVEWLREEGCPWNEEVFEAAATRCNNLEILKYLFENGCPMNEKIFTEALIAGDINMLEWLLDNNFPHGDLFEINDEYPQSDDCNEWLEKNRERLDA